MSKLSLKDQLKMQDCQDEMDSMLAFGITEDEITKSQVYQDWCDLCDKAHELDDRFQYDERGE